MTQIVFNFTGNVTIHVNGATLPNDPKGVSFLGPAFASATTDAPAANVTGEDKPFAFDRDAEEKAKLTELLSDSQYRFRNIGTLSEAIDRSEEDTESLLHVIGARQEANNSELWGLKSRVGEAKSY
jgi:hypothetical protein